MNCLLLNQQLCLPLPSLIIPPPFPPSLSFFIFPPSLATHSCLMKLAPVSQLQELLSITLILLTRFMLLLLQCSTFLKPPQLVRSSRLTSLGTKLIRLLKHCQTTQQEWRQSEYNNNNNNYYYYYYWLSLCAISDCACNIMFNYFKYHKQSFKHKISSVVGAQHVSIVLVSWWQFEFDKEYYTTSIQLAKSSLENYTVYKATNLCIKSVTSGGIMNKVLLLFIIYCATALALPGITMNTITLNIVNSCRVGQYWRWEQGDYWRWEQVIIIKN